MRSPSRQRINCKPGQPPTTCLPKDCPGGAPRAATLDPCPSTRFRELIKRTWGPDSEEPKTVDVQEQPELGPLLYYQHDGIWYMRFRKSPPGFV